MDNLIYAFQTNGYLHHAYFVVGDGKAVRELVANISGGDMVGNPDIWQRTFTTFTVDDARALSDAQERKDFGGGRKFFILEAEQITEEAQNALLKVFEEPTEGTYFFIICPQDMLVPTLRSRMHIVRSRQPDTASENILEKNIAERLSLVKKITDGIADEEKTKQDGIALLNQVEEELYKKGVVSQADALAVTESARAALYDRGAPVKMILEHVMISV